MKRIILAFTLGFFASFLGLISVHEFTEQVQKEGQQQTEQQNRHRLIRKMGGSEFDCGAMLDVPDHVCPNESGVAEITNLPDECGAEEYQVSWSSGDGVKLMKDGEEVQEGQELNLEEYQTVDVTAEADVGTQPNVEIEASLTEEGNTCEECGTASDTTDVGCSLDITADNTSVNIGNSTTLTVTYNQCGNTSSTDSCTMDVTGSGQTENGDSMNSDTDFHIDTSSITFWGGEGEETIEVTGYREGTLNVQVGGGSGSCNCGSEQEQITINDDGSSGSEIRISLDTRSEEENSEGYSYLCSAQPGEYELNRYCWGESNETDENANVRVSVDGGIPVDQFEEGPQEFSLTCGETRTGELNVSNLDEEDEETRENFPRLKAESSCCGQDTTDRYDPDFCRADLSGGDNVDSDSPVCPGTELSFNAVPICKREGCADGIDWTYPAGLTKQSGGDGTNELSLKNESNRPVGGSVIAAVNQEQGSECQNCESEHVSLGSAIREGNYEVAQSEDESIPFGADGDGLQLADFKFGLGNTSNQGFLAGANDLEKISSIEIVNITVSTVALGNQFPWIKRFVPYSDRPTIEEVSIGEETFEVDDKIYEGEPVHQANVLEGETVVMDYSEFSEPDPLQVEVYTPRNDVEIFANIGFRVNFQDRCGESRSFGFGQQFRGIGRFNGLEVKRIPNIVFAESEYWMPLKVELPEFVSDTHGQSSVEEVKVTLREDGEFERRTLGQVTTDSAELADGLGWGFGDGATSQGEFQKVESESDKVLDGRRTITVFVNLDELFDLIDALNETEDSTPVHMIEKNDQIRMPHFNVHISLNSDLRVDSSLAFASLEPEKGRPDLLADEKVGPVIEAEKEPQNVDWITKETNSNGYLAPIVYQEAKLKHDEGKQVYTTSSGTEDIPNLLIHKAFLPNLPKASDMRTEYDEGFARSANRTNNGSPNLADLELMTNLAEVTNNTGFTGEKGASIATLSTGALFYLSYGKNDEIYEENDDVEIMDLSEKRVDVEINEPPFEGGRLALGRKSFDDSLAVDITVSVAAFVAGAAITYGTGGAAAWAYVGTALSAGSTTYGILSALDEESNAANVTRVEFDARLFTPEQYARKFAEETRLDEIPESTELGWNVDAHPPASEDRDSGKIIWELTGDTYEFSDVRFPGNSGEFFLNSRFSTTDRKVGQRIDFRFHARMESSMKNELIDDIQVISKIWYDHPNQSPLRNIEVEPVNE